MSIVKTIRDIFRPAPKPLPPSLNPPPSSGNIGRDIENIPAPKPITTPSSPSTPRVNLGGSNNNTSTGSGGYSTGGGSSYQGPVQQGTSEETFRVTGTTTPIQQNTTSQQIKSAVTPSQNMRNTTSSQNSWAKPQVNPFNQYPQSRQPKQQSGLSIQKQSSAYRGQQYGIFAVSEDEIKTAKEKGSTGFYNTLPYNVYAPTSKNAIDVFEESAIISQTPIYTQPTRASAELNVRNINRAKDIYVNEIQPFQLEPDKFVSEGKAIGLTTEEGTSYSLNPDYINQKYFSEEANLKYTRQGKDFFKELSPVQRMRLTTTGEAYAIGGVGVGLTELGGTVFKTGFGNVNPTWKEGEKPKFFNLKKFELNNDFTNEFKFAPEVPSSYATRRIPILGIDIPKNSKDIYGFTKEIGTRPTQSINIFGTSLLAGQGIKGLMSARTLYKEERLTGSTKLGALNTLGGEAVYNLSPFRVNQRIFTAETTLSRYKTTQLNKGDIQSALKVGKYGEDTLFTQGMLPEKAVYVTPKTTNYISFKPKLTGFEWKTGTIKTGELSIVSLRGNLFRTSPTQDENVFNIMGRGQRETNVWGTRVIQQDRYTLGTQSYYQKNIQGFKSTGSAKTFGDKLTFSVSRTEFKPIEKYSYEGGFRNGLKEIAPKVTKQGKAFGKGISGRPSVAKGYEFEKEIYNVETDFGKTIYGKSIGKSISGGRRGVTTFSTRTIIPKNDFFGISETSPSGTGVNMFKGTGRKATIGIYDDLMQKGVQSSIKQTLSLPKTTQLGRTGLISEVKQTGRGRSIGAQRNKEEVSVRTFTSQRIAPITASSLFERQKTDVIFSPRIKDVFNFGTGIKTNQILVQPQMTNQQTDNVFGGKVISPRITPSGRGYDFFGKSYVPPPVVPFPGGFNLFDYGRRGTKGKRNTFKSRYTSNIASVALNLRAPKIPKSYTKGLGGITIRPLIIKGFGKKKRRSKK